LKLRYTFLRKKASAGRSDDISEDVRMSKQV